MLLVDYCDSRVELESRVGLIKNVAQGAKGFKLKFSFDSVDFNYKVMSTNHKTYKISSKGVLNLSVVRYLGEDGNQRDRESLAAKFL